MKTSNPPTFSFLKKTWHDNANSSWLGATVTIYRNLEKYLFPHKESLDKRQQIIPIIAQQVTQKVSELNFQTFMAENIGPLEKEFLFEHFLTHESLNQAHAGEAFLLAAEGNILIGINLQNHLTFHLIDSGIELEKSLASLIKLETAVGETLSYAFSPRFGFLTADPLLCGTGLAASVFLQLPALIHTNKLSGILEKNNDEMVVISGLQGKEQIGDVVVISNNFTLGVTEEKIISSLNIISTKLQVAEASERTKLAKKESVEIKDKVSRAYAILMHSYQIEAVEAMNALSLLKLGLALGWIENITLDELNALFFSCRRAHLITQLGGKIVNEQLPHKRAEFIHNILKKAVLHL